MTDNDSRSDKAAALLALGLSREPAAFDRPSDEELAQLLEAEAGVAPMDSTRRAQIMDSIANDAETFARWMALVESAETLGLAGFAASSEARAREKSAAGESLLAKITGWFANPLGGLTAAGGGLVAASALFFMVLSPGGLEGQLNDLYEGHGGQWSERPAAVSLTRDLGRDSMRVLNAEDSALSEGVQEGLAALGPEFKLHRLLPASEAEPAPESTRKSLQTLRAAGKLAAISYFKCSLVAEPEYFERALELQNALAKKLAESGDATSQALRETLQQTRARGNDAETQVCGFGETVVDRVSAQA